MGWASERRRRQLRRRASLWKGRTLNLLSWHTTRQITPVATSVALHVCLSLAEIAVLTRSASALSCAATESCAAVIVQDVASMVCCAPGGGCVFFGNCVAYAGFYSSGLCDGACQS